MPPYTGFGITVDNGYGLRFFQTRTTLCESTSLSHSTKGHGVSSTYFKIYQGLPQPLGAS